MPIPASEKSAAKYIKYRTFAVAYLPLVEGTIHLTLSLNAIALVAFIRGHPTNTKYATGFQSCTPMIRKYV